MDWIVVAVAVPSVVVAYIIFGIAGFGTALVSAPVLAQVMPVAKVVPLLALLDFIAAAVSGLRMTKNVVVGELRWQSRAFTAVSICFYLPGLCCQA